MFEAIELIVLEFYHRIIGLQLSDLPAHGCSTKAPCGGECSGPSPVDRRKLGLKRSTITDATGIPLAAVTAPGNCHDAPLLAPTLDKLGRLGPMPHGATVHLDAAYGAQKGTATCARFGLAAKVAVLGVAAPIQNTKRWPVERTNAWGNQFFKLARCTERRGTVTTSRSSTRSSRYADWSARLGRLSLGQPTEEAPMTQHLSAHALTLSRVTRRCSSERRPALKNSVG